MMTKRGSLSLLFIAFLLMVCLAAPAGAAVLWKDGFEGGVPEQAWVQHDKGDNSTFAFVNNRYEIHTENLTMASDKWAGAYVAGAVRDGVIQARVRQLVAGDIFLAGLILRGDPASDSGYAAYFHTNGMLYIVKKTNGANAEVMRSIVVAGVNASDFQLKFAAVDNYLYAKAWTSGELEPAGWQATVADGDFVSGVAGVTVSTGAASTGYINPSQAAFDDVTVNSVVIPAAERSILIDLYNSTGGDAWTANTGWKTPPLHTDGFAMPGTESGWFGITLDATGNVSGVALPCNNLVGPIPASLGGLAHLKVLDLGMGDKSCSNHLSGAIPDSLGNLAAMEIMDMSGIGLTGSIPIWLGSMANLRLLNLRYNQFTGTIPDALGNLANLESLSLSGNQLTGGIPSWLGSLANLRYLYLNNNQFTGTIPDTLGSLANLATLDLSSNQLTGSLPGSLENLTNLMGLYLSGNQLTGEIPGSLGSLTNLRDLELGFNQFTGTIPDTLKNLANLQILYLPQNELTGEIPSWLGNLSNLEALSLAYNQFTGIIPEALGNLANIKNLNLSRNQLSGGIPSWLGSLGKLQDLELGNNQFTGPIPDIMGNLANLKILILEANQLTDGIPSWIGSLINLNYLMLGNNQFKGAIPDTLGNLTNLIYLRINNNQLSGPIPASIQNLTALADGQSDFRYNSLYTTDDALRTFLNTKQIGGDWESYQSVTPNGERLALIDLYNSTNGDAWTTNTGWKTPPLHTDGFAMPGTEGTWFGVTVDGTGWVTGITLEYNNLEGTIPASIADLQKLRSLVLWRNALSGTIPVEVSTLADLADLNLAYNQLSGPIPTELGNLLTLTNLQLEFNTLTGSIPPELGQLSNLTNLNLSKNGLTGPIPAELGDLSNLTSLDMNQNQLSGPIPPELAKLTNLRLLWLFSNDLSGPIPSGLGDLTNLDSLLLGDNQFSGPIPAEMGNLVRLQLLEMNSNQLTGPVPASLQNLSALAALDLRWNALYTDDDALRAFLNGKQTGGDWEGTQTVVPANFHLVSASEDGTAVLGWDPIAYADDAGFYSVSSSAGLKGTPWALSGRTKDKGASSLNIAGLTPGATIYFRIETVTEPHADNRNTVNSGYSAPISVTLPEPVEPPPAVTFTVAFSAGEGGRVEGDTAQVVVEGGTCAPVSAVADAGYVFTGWSGDYAGTENPVTIAGVTRNMAIQAMFARNTHAVAFSSGAGGTLSGETAQTVPVGGACSPVTAVADEGHDFTGWTGDYTGTDNPLTVTNVTRDMAISAGFAIRRFAVGFSAEKGGKLSGETSQTVDYGASAKTVTATSETGYHFVKWTDGNGVVAGTNAALTVTDVKSEMRFTANFKINTYTVTFSSGAGGTLSGDTTQTVEHGKDCRPVTAAPENGFGFIGWTGDAQGTANPLTVTGVTRDMAVTAVFEAGMGNPAAPPDLVSPENGALVSGSAVLTAGLFSDPENDPHVGSRWQIGIPGETDLVYDVYSASDLTTHEVPQGVLESGVRYRWRVGYEDGGSALLSWSLTREFVFGERSQDLAPPSADPGVDQKDYRMVSWVQYVPPAFLDDLLTDQGLLEDGRPRNEFKIGTYDPTLDGTGGYVEYPHVAVEPGRACWCWVRPGMGLGSEGISVSLNRDFAVALNYNEDNQNGWNMVACPNGAAYPWGDVAVEARDASGKVVFQATPVSDLADDNPYVDRRLHAWVEGGYEAKGVEFVMRRYAGYWVKAKQSGVRLIFRPGVQVEDAGLSGALKDAMDKAGRWLAALTPFSRAAHAVDDSPPMPMSLEGVTKPSYDVDSSGCFIDTQMPRRHP